MPKDPRHTVREGRHIAWRSAWDTFGRRHWRWFVYGRLFAPSAVVVGIAIPVVVAWRTVDPFVLSMASIVLGGAAIALGVTMRLSMTGTRSAMMGRRPIAPTVFMAGGTLLLTLGVLALTL